VTEILIIQTPWVGSASSNDPNRPKLLAAYSGKYTDVTNQPSENIPPDANVFSCRFECDLATAEAIEADSDYYIQSWVSDA